MKSLQKLALSLLATAALSSCGSSSSTVSTLAGTSLDLQGCGYGSLERNDGVLYGMELQIIAQVNQVRAANGLAALRQHGCIDMVAYFHSVNMAKQQNASHVLDGKDVHARLQAADINTSWWGENIHYAWASANGQPQWDSAGYPNTAMGFWLNSPGHRANILNPNYTYLAVGISKSQVGDKGYFYATQVFMTE